MGIAQRIYKSAMSLMRNQTRVRGEKHLWATPWWTLPSMRKCEPTRQVLRRALTQTAYKKLKEKWGGQDRRSLRSMSRALGYKTFRETPMDTLLGMYRKAEGLGRVA